MKYETRILSRDEALSFMQNMRWFAGFGRITARLIKRDLYRVRATRGAWSQWVSLN